MFPSPSPSPTPSASVNRADGLALCPERSIIFSHGDYQVLKAVGSQSLGAAATARQQWHSLRTSERPLHLITAKAYTST